MASAVAGLVAALERAEIPFCQWKGARALERALHGERDLDGLVRAADWERALVAIEGAGWKRARPRRGADEPGVAHFFGYDPALPRLLHLHLHDAVLTGEDWINSHALPFAEDYLASRRRAQGVRVPEPAGEAALLVLKHAIRWGSWPDLLTSWLRPTRELEESRALLDEGTLAAAAALVAARCPALDPELFRACAAACAGAPARRGPLARRVRRALRPWQRRRGLARQRAYLAVATARVRRWLDGNRTARGPAAGAATLELEGADLARAHAAAAWLAPAFAVRGLDTAHVDAGALHAACAAGETLLVAGALPEALRAAAPRFARLDGRADEGALRAAIWSAL